MTPPGIRFHILGLQRSGTTWLGHLLGNNFKVEVSGNGKHDLPGEYEHLHDGPVYLIRKRLDHWLNSIARRSETLPGTHPEIYPDGKLSMYKAAQLHERFYREWLNLYAYDVQPVSYEEILADPCGFLERVQAVHHPQLRRDTWKLQGRGDAEMSDARREYYMSVNEWGGK